MGFFNKKKDVIKKKENVPSLPDLPRLPELPPIEGEVANNPSKPLHQLPTFPNNSLGDKFSQNTIKEAVIGKKEGERVLDANDFAEEDEMQMMSKPFEEKFSLPKIEPPRLKSMTRKIEPLFVRIDKFEESLQIFETVKKQVSEIDNLLKNIEEIKTNEERELKEWESEIQIIKGQIERIDKELFSKLE